MLSGWVFCSQLAGPLGLDGLKGCHSRAWESAGRAGRVSSWASSPDGTIERGSSKALRDQDLSVIQQHFQHLLVKARSQGSPDSESGAVESTSGERNCQESGANF